MKMKYSSIQLTEKKLFFDSLFCFCLFFSLMQIIMRKAQSLKLVTMNH